eukprot:NODE_2092_length_458_cov_1232.775061_g2013_i0.p2 GENE.NODE_2092_length_458_cov_1232.775061_g2013_i0~~NODE_2092_length_458_cov_1232.775061_g2013_i0.p2  ORF type:complete len:63 (-),score=12.64 NODE_2092_length_458_cov_1232.775061_g2013_i0:191-379(-)
MSGPSAPHDILPKYISYPPIDFCEEVEEEKEEVKHQIVPWGNPQLPLCGTNYLRKARKGLWN